MESYTMEEFKNMYTKAEIEVIRKLQKEIEESDNTDKLDSMHLMAFSLQNMWCLKEMYHTLFK